MQQAADETFPVGAILSVQREEAEPDPTTSEGVGDDADHDGVELDVASRQLDHQLHELAFGRRLVGANEEAAIARIEHLDGFRTASLHDVSRKGDPGPEVFAALVFMHGSGIERRRARELK